jgi:protein subunit release factor A
MKTEILSQSESEAGGVKEIVLGIRRANRTASSNTRAACIACSAFR